MSDADLLALFYAEKNSEWLGILLQRYTLMLFGVCFKYLKDEEEAKDIVQQVFLKALTGLEQYRVAHPKSWLYIVAKNQCLMRLRERRTARLPDALSLPHTDAPFGERETAEFTYECLQEALHALSPEQQTCVNLFYLQKKSYQQIHEITGFSLSQVKSYIQNGKRNLKQALERKQYPLKVPR